eukprot:TRINITY_DN14249_c0_g1_i1.p1 TRINITY_DN14249_c0_g1~~TRINITY_DN14249_c0_g1_i1.p1  ORF type:complete len:570 (+),score=109.32 TRINITY_DN14249_c0_g1_i1:45-1754(+)
MKESCGEVCVKKLSFVTDVEGNWNYWCKVVENSAVLKFKKDCNRNDPAAVELAEGEGFIFGGDVFDKGPGDLRLGAQLVSLKERYPKRVHLIMGNRDLNKLRYAAELHSSDIARKIDEIPAPFWVKQRDRVSLRKYLTQLSTTTTSSPSSSLDLEKFNTRTNRLKWMLIHTLGCPKTFEFRRQELQLLAEQAAISKGEKKDVKEIQITDDDVTQNMIDSVLNKTGIVRRYLELSVPAVIVGDTLFVHGAAEKKAVGWIPMDGHRYAVIDDAVSGGSIAGGRDVRDTMSAREWVDELCRFTARGMQDFNSHPFWDSKRLDRGGQALIAYQSRPAMRDRTVTVTSYCFGGNMPLLNTRGVRSVCGGGEGDAPDMSIIDNSDPLDESTVEYLAKSGIRRVVVGHKPSADAPAVMSYAASFGSAACARKPPGLEVISSDISYSDTSFPDNRGPNAWCEVILEFCCDDAARLESSAATLHGTLRDGGNYNVMLPKIYNGNGGEEDVDGDRFVGQVVRQVHPDDGEGDHLWWVKVRVESGEYLLSRGASRRDVRQKYAQAKDFTVCKALSPYSDL